MRSTPNKNAVIVAYGRSAVARAGKGSLRHCHPVDYASQVLEGVLSRAPSVSRDVIEDVVLGCAKPEGVQGSNMGRVVAQRVGLPDSVPGQTVNRFCASGLQAIASAAYMIMAGQAQVLVAGGAEDMTAIPMGTKEEFRNGWIAEHKPGVYLPMGITAENVAERYGVSRLEMEKFAVASHDKAAAARREGKFAREIVPVTSLDDNGAASLFTVDEGIRDDCSLEKLAALKPSFRDDGRVTAATSSQVSDGAAFVLLMEEEAARKAGVRPIARFVSYAVAGVPADMMGVGPIAAVPKALALAGLGVDELDVVELNEAFAAQAIPCISELRLPSEKVNPRGGAIALGHPLGATGAILVCKALSFLEDGGGRNALVSMCIGGGMGAAGVFEMIR